MGRNLKYGNQSPRDDQCSAILKTPSFLGTSPFQAFLLSSIETTERPVLVIDIDDSSHSFYALEWTLDHFFSPPKTKPFKLVIDYARPPLSFVIGFAGSGKAIIFSLFGSRENNGTEQNTRWKWVHFSQQPNRENVPSLKKKIKMLQKCWNDVIFFPNMSVWYSSLQGFLCGCVTEISNVSFHSLMGFFICP